MLEISTRLKYPEYKVPTKMHNTAQACNGPFLEFLSGRIYLFTPDICIVYIPLVEGDGLRKQAC